MLGIESKRENITGGFVRRIWSEVLAIWHRDKVNYLKIQSEKIVMVTR